MQNLTPFPFEVLKYDFYLAIILSSWRHDRRHMRHMRRANFRGICQSRFSRMSQAISFIIYHR